MAEQRTKVHIDTTNSRAEDAREVLRLLRGNLEYHRHPSGTVETLQSVARDAPRDPDAPRGLAMYLAGDVKQEIENQLAAMDPTFDVRVEVWEDFDL